MEFYWTTEYQHDRTHLLADRGTALLVIDYAEIQTNLHRSSRSGTDPRSEALEIAKVFATELIDDRPNALLCDQPMLVFQVLILER
jgi:hypothetical protein